MKNTQRGAASTGVIIALLIAGVFVVLAFVVAMVFMRANNTANAFEQKVKYEHTNNKNVLSGYNQKILEAAQVPEMARDDIMKVAQAAIQGRYGAEGSKAVFQAITEQNPNIDSQLYVKLQQIIEAGRDEFKTSQTRLLDVKRSYETALGSMPQGFIMGLMGFPKVPLDTYNIVTTDRTERAFEKGREDAPLQLRAPAPAK